MTSRLGNLRPDDGDDHASMEDLRREIISYAGEQGADLIGFARVEKWPEAAEVPPEFWPQALWPPARTVIVLGMGLPLPIVETTPSAIHMELYNTCNRELDGLAYRLASWLNRRGCASIFFPRDCYGSIKILMEKPFAAFGHVPAAKYAGLGTVGLSRLLLTPAFGPRVRFVSVFTEADLENSPLPEKELCIRCRACIKCCPPGALKYPAPPGEPAVYDKIACARRADELTRRRCYPCGICSKVCPVGEDRKLFKAVKSTEKYLRERELLKKEPDHPDYRGWEHFRRYGSWYNNENDE